MRAGESALEAAAECAFVAEGFFLYVATGAGDGVVPTQVFVVEKYPPECGAGVGYTVDTGSIVLRLNVGVVVGRESRVGVVGQVAEIEVQVFRDDGVVVGRRVGDFRFFARRKNKDRNGKKGKGKKRCFVMAVRVVFVKCI